MMRVESPVGRRDRGLPSISQFLLPLHVIDETVQLIRDNLIANVSYGLTTARLIC